DYEILEGSIAYCQEYADRWHHPREDALLELLERRDPAQARACEDLKEQHLTLSRTTADLVKTFEHVEHDAEYPRARLVELGRRLIGDYHRHLDWEEANFFPVLADLLTSDDWRDVTSRYLDVGDPMTEVPVDPRYRALSDAIDEPRA